MTTIRRLSASLALGLLLLTACATVTRENYDRIRTGMTLDEVVDILGEPDDLDSVGLGPLEAANATWVGKSGTISIQFAGGKVLVKRFLSNDEGAPREQKR
jgi:hypothetical protein